MSLFLLLFCVAGGDLWAAMLWFFFGGWVKCRLKKLVRRQPRGRYVRIHEDQLPLAA